MNAGEHTLLHRVATFLINTRYAIVILFVAITFAMGFAMSQLRIETGFKKQLPLKHEYMQTFLQYEQEFGGANRILVALVARDGDMFTEEFFTAFEEITNQTFFIPGVDRASVRSIFTPNVRFVEIVEDGFAGGNVIPSAFAPTPAMFQRVRSNIVKSGEVGRLVSGGTGADPSLDRKVRSTRLRGIWVRRVRLGSGFRPRNRARWHSRAGDLR